ncbi:sensor histidine kinase [Nonomuraea aurantiaca]|uniref:sensor histidine kinase n=1 Tax=Nonomuraea aurantiaca TaxID=2878562 RepID=UPI001CDA3B5D|nr:histidine kinase [Nonomuraea aurantiaca]MCA2227419.1 histidine kinase [Nonomuraea aurantiaca]
MTEHTHSGDGPRGPFKALSRMARLGDVPVVIMLAWAGWLAVPWSFSGLAQARAAAAAAAAEAEPPPVISTGTAGPSTDAVRVGALADAVRTGLPHDAARTGAPADTVRTGSLPIATPARAWGIPAAHSLTPAHRTVRALRDGAPCDETLRDETLHGDALRGDVPCEGASVDRASVDSASVDSASADGPSADGASADGPRKDVLAAERARIAGEVHDAAGHGLAAIALQAGLALVTLDDDPEQARASLLAIKATSTTALTQLRAALDRLDPRDSTHDPRDSADDARDGAHDLPSLIDGVRAAGLAVDVRPADPVVPAHLSATVYGVVRESLTNVLRHAGTTQALVRLSGDPNGPLVLEIADRGPDQGADRPGAAVERARGADRPGAIEERGRAGTTGDRGRVGAAEGRGLAGMRARVLAAGGHFTAGPRDGGGFQVLATFPQQPALHHGSAHHTRQPALPNGSAHHNTADSPADLT